MSLAVFVLLHGNTVSACKHIGMGGRLKIVIDLEKALGKLEVGVGGQVLGFGAC